MFQIEKLKGFYYVVIKGTDVAKIDVEKKNYVNLILGKK